MSPRNTLWTRGIKPALPTAAKCQGGCSDDLPATLKPTEHNMTESKQCCGQNISDNKLFGLYASPVA